MREFNNNFVCIGTTLLFLFFVYPLLSEVQGSENRATSAVPTHRTADIVYISLILTVTDQNGVAVATDETFNLYLRSDAKQGWDTYDASKRLPQEDTWAAIAFLGMQNGENVLKAQESRPFVEEIQTFEMELIRKNVPAGTYTLDVETWHSVPADWSLKIRSQSLDTTFVFDEATDTASFTLEGSEHASSSQNMPVYSPQPKSTSDTTSLSMSGEIGPNSSLPVELNSFTAHLNHDQAELQWSTSSETNNSGFAVQHRRDTASSTAASWSKIGFVDGAGTTQQAQTYRFTSSPLPSGTHFFRLKQVNMDGTTDVTEPVGVVQTENENVTLSTAPNPFANRLSVSVSARTSQTITLQLVNTLGRVVKQHGPLQIPASSTRHIELKAHHLSSGTYLLYVNGETFTDTRRLTRIR